MNKDKYYFPYSCRYFFIAYRHLQNQMKRLGKVSINNPPSSLAGLVDMELQENKQSRHVPFWYNCQGENLFGSATCWLFIFNSICPKVTSFMANGRAVLPSPFWQVSIEDIYDTIFRSKSKSSGGFPIHYVYA